MDRLDISSEDPLLQALSPQKRRDWKPILRNPFLWTSCICAVYAIVAFVCLAEWKFMFGMAITAVYFVLNVVLAVEAAVYARHMERSRWKWAAFGIICLTLQGLIGWRVGVLIDVRFATPDPDLNAFPTKCHPADGTIRNCAILADVNVALAGAEPPRYNASVAAVTDYYATMIGTGLPLKSGGHAWLRELMQCMVLRQQVAQGEGFVHARCLSTFLGYPDDVAVRVFCLPQEPGASHRQAEVWIYSQSRQGSWDWTKNSGRIRLLLDAQQLGDAYVPNAGSC